MLYPPPLKTVLHPLTYRSAAETRLFRWEYVLAVMVLGVLAFLKLRYIHALTVNPDEPQHLHVAWSWTQGLVQYRDTFDNHVPLFHMLMSPLVGWLGERADILYPMRLAMLPLSIGTMAFVCWIGTRLYSFRAGLWSALLLGLSPFYLLVSTEFRTDNLWAFCWMFLMVLLFTGRLGKARSFAAGIFLGASFCISLKTSLLFLSLVVAGGVVLLCRMLIEAEPGFMGRVIRNTLLGLLGASVIPLILIGYFALQDSLGPLYYGVFEHNMAPGLKRYGFDRWNFPLLAPVILVVTWLVYRAAPTPELASRRAIVWMSGSLSLTLLMAYWPMVTRQDFAVISPFIALSLGPGLMAATHAFYKWWSSRFRGLVGALGLVVALLVPVGVAAYHVERSLNVWGIEEDSLQSWSRGLERRLKLTRPGDIVMDAKGETVFRRRAFYYVLEGVTLYRLKKGMTQDTIEEDCRRTNTCIVFMGRLPDKNLEWIRKAYVPIEGNTWVAGQILPVNGTDTRRFQLDRSARYTFVSKNGTLSGAVNGRPVNGSVQLEPGTYEFTSPEGGEIAAVWSQAVEAGFTPFNIRERTKREGKKKKIPTNPFSKQKSEKSKDAAEESEA